MSGFITGLLDSWIIDRLRVPGGRCMQLRGLDLLINGMGISAWGGV